MQKYNVIIFCKGNPSRIQPVINSIDSLKNFCHIKIICGEMNKETLDFLYSVYNQLSIEQVKPSKLKLLTWLRYHIYAWKRIKEEKFDFLWISTGDTALCLGFRLKKYRFILNILELYDNAPIYRILLGKMAKYAYKIVVPEYNRACIFRTWWKLNETPIVIPNKPIFQNITKTPEIENIITDINNKKLQRKIVLYQGLIASDRNLDIIAKTIYKLKNEFLFVIMGTDFGYLEKLKNINNDIYYIPNIPSPLHLNITEISDIGIVIYDFIDLNNIYCAPNKIWEYSRFSKPMLGSNVPGLQYTIEANNAGICINSQDENDIETALLKIIKNYDKFYRASQDFYDAVDMNKQFESIIFQYSKK